MRFFNFFKPRLSKDFVELSIGKVYFKEITGGIENRVRTKSIVAGNVINNNLYFQLMEYELVNLSKKDIDNLPIRDANKIRDKVKQILIDNELIEKDKQIETESNNIFSKKDVEWFNKSKADMLKRLKHGRN